MGRYILRRLLWVILLLFIVSAVTFFIFYTLPAADPAVLRAGKSPDPHLIASIRHNLGLDKPITEQYRLYMARVLPFDLHGHGFPWIHFKKPYFGYSYQNSQP